MSVRIAPRPAGAVEPVHADVPSAVDLITVDAVVVDGKGQPVPGLAREDFVLAEDGRPQPIVTFEAVEGPATPMAPPAVADPAVIATNSAPPGPGRAFAVMLDDVWIKRVDVPAVRDALTQFLERPFRESPDGAAAAARRAKAIQEESARFNLGPVRRTLNVPTFALLVLHPDHQHRFSFESAGRTSIDGTETVQIAFTEKVRPTLVAGAGGDVLSKGHVWIDD